MLTIEWDYLFKIRISHRIKKVKVILFKNPKQVINFFWLYCNSQTPPLDSNNAKLASIYYCFAIDGLITRLHNRLQGHVYHKLPTQGPRHPQLGPPSPAEARAKVFGYIDDVKGVLCSLEEFHTLDHAFHLFEKASGSRLHRDPTTRKCQIDNAHLPPAGRHWIPASRSTATLCHKSCQKTRSKNLPIFLPTSSSPSENYTKK